MAQITADFETGVNGNTIATSDAGSATAWDVVNIGASATATYDNTHAAFGTLSGKLVSTANNVRLEWSTAFGTQTDHWGRMYLWVSSITGYINLINAYQGASIGGIVRLQDNGKFIFIDGPVNVSGESTTALTFGQWVRVEWHILHSTTVGVIETKLFNTASATVPDETFSWTGRNTQSNATRLFFGTVFDSGNLHTVWLDNIIGNATSYPGPVSTDTGLAWIRA